MNVVVKGCKVPTLPFQQNTCVSFEGARIVVMKLLQKKLEFLETISGFSQSEDQKWQNQCFPPTKGYFFLLRGVAL